MLAKDETIGDWMRVLHNLMLLGHRDSREGPPPFHTNHGKPTFVEILF